MKNELINQHCFLWTE